MIYFIKGTDLEYFPRTRDTMFCDRKAQFIDRLRWPLQETHGGYEIDEYDTPEAMYIICTTDCGKHKGSMRLIPTNKSHMIKDHFSSVIPGILFNTEKIWECTRFCVAPGAGTMVSKSVLAAAAKIMKEYSLFAFLAVFNEYSGRVYRRFGTHPMVIGSKTVGNEAISVAMWNFNTSIFSKLVEGSLYTLQDYEEMYSNAASQRDRRDLTKPLSPRLELTY